MLMIQLRASNQFFPVFLEMLEKRVIEVNNLQELTEQEKSKIRLNSSVNVVYDTNKSFIKFYRVKYGPSNEHFFDTVWFDEPNTFEELSYLTKDELNIEYYRD